MVSREVFAEAKFVFENHSLTGGSFIKFVNLNGNINEFYSETGPNAIQSIPIVTMDSRNVKLNSAGFYIEEIYLPSNYININAGLRYLHNSFTNENLFSPRINLSLNFDQVDIFKFGWGFYYQPPFYNEIIGLDENIKLRSQRSIQYNIGWEHQFSATMDLQIDAYYKDLDNLIPFYYEEIKPIYLYGSIDEGRTYGLDIMLRGHLVEGIESRIGYSYLDSKEREKGTGERFRRRLLDQTHTFQIFLQDRIRKHPNWQAHTRFLVGSGFLFASRAIKTNPATGSTSLVADIKHPEEYFLYFRVDMGLSAAFDVGSDSKLVVIAEVLNMFNHYNVGGYDWMMVYKDFVAALRIPRILSKRFFNLRAELSL
jgi:outer membrane receptor protein involved in Fe transport